MTILRNGRSARGAGKLAMSAVLGGVLCAGVATDAAFAGPDGARVRRGDVTIRQRGDRTIIRASDGSIIEFDRFNIRRHELVRFIQPGEFARVLNRITGDNPTFIRGMLRANGQVYIVNPAGVVFTRSATVNVGQLYAAAGTITDQQFIRGVDRFQNLKGDVVNRGSIRGNAVHLVGEHVANHGSIRATAGVVTMVAGDDVLIRRVGERITLRVDGRNLTERARPAPGGTAPDLDAKPGVQNTGTIDANRGQVALAAGDMYAYGIHNRGTIRAAAGEIRAAAADGVVRNDGAITTGVSNGVGGEITVHAPSVVNSGEITADAQTGQAGTVKVFSDDHTYLLDGSRVSAAGGRGDASGGEVRINSFGGLTAHADGAVLDVSGGRRGGDGGFAELSGRSLFMNGDVELGARRGSEKGTLLIDPLFIRIRDTGTGMPLLDDNIVTFPEAGAVIIAIADETLEAIDGDIVLQAEFDIFVDHPVDFVNSNSLRLDAGRNIFVNQPITGLKDLTLVGDFDGNGTGELFLRVPLVDISSDARFSAPRINPEGRRILTGGAQVYRGDVVLGADSRLRADRFRFAGAVDGGFQLDLDSDAGAFFGGDIGAADPLARLDVRAGGVITFDANLVSTLGDLTLDSDRLGRPGPAVASIAGVGGDLTLRSANGDVALGRNNRLSVLGDLLIDAAGVATVGDLSTLGDMTVDAPTIRIWTRQPGNVLQSDGTIVPDLGVDFVAGGGIDFSSTPSLLGGGPAPIFAALNAGRVSSTLARFEQTDFGEVGRSRFFLSGTVLDLAARFGQNDLAEALAEERAVESTNVVDRILLDPLVRQNLSEMGINVRDLRAEELVESTNGIILVNDAYQRLDPATAEWTTVVARLRRSLILDALDRFRVLFYGEDAPADAQLATLESREGEIRAAFAEAWRDYEGGASGFRPWIEGAGRADLVAHLASIEAILANLRVSGLSRAEFNHAAETILGKVMPEGLSRDEMLQIVGGAAVTAR